MFEIKTKRLRLLPLDYENLMLLKESRADMEQNLGLVSSNLTFSGEFRELRAETFEFWLENAGDMDSDYRWHTNWEIILAEENRSIGGASFLGAPNRKGEVILGYILHQDYRKKGIMSEAISAISDWALKEGGARRVISFVQKESEAVDKLLKKCGFRKEVIYVKE